MKKWIIRTVVLLFVVIITWTLIDSFVVQLEHVDVVVADLPQALDGYRIVQISDFHGRKFAADGRLIRQIADVEADLIVLTGDYVHSKAREVDNILPFIAKLVELAPVYAVSGNHDHWSDWPLIANQLELTGVSLLENRYVRLRHEGRTFILAGVGDPYTGHDDLQAALPAIVTGPVVLLAHAPTWFEPQYQDRYGGLPVYAAQQQLLRHISLTLAGHTHGGQIKLPFIGAVTTASGRLFPDSHVEGLSQEETGWLYISRGIGQGGILPLRFMSRAEVSVLTLKSTN
ncbi:MAG: metallophosphoesterase [Firmicutes bacterium]|nr:metallophosphoesterase [Bacillota bacterium]